MEAEKKNLRGGKKSVKKEERQPTMKL